MEIGFLHTSGSATSPLPAGRALYLADREGGLLAVDLCDLAEPVRLSRVFEAGSVRAVDVAVSEGHAFVAMHRERLRAVDVSDPASAQEVRASDARGGDGGGVGHGRPPAPGRWRRQPEHLGHVGA